MTDILFEIKENIAVITFNRPEVLNVFRRAMFQRLLGLLDDAANDGSIRVVLMTGEKISAQSALELGLVTRVVPSEILLNKGFELARMLAANAPISMRLVKQVLNQSYDLDLESVMQLETEATLECLASEDLQEGVQSFLEKRAPIYKGK